MNLILHKALKSSELIKAKKSHFCVSYYLMVYNQQQFFLTCLKLEMVTFILKRSS